MTGRLEAAKRIYNATLADGLKTLEEMKSSLEWAVALKLPQGAARTEAFIECRKLYEFSLYDLELVAAKRRKSGRFERRVGSQETQKLAARAFSALEQYCFGARGRPRFKGVIRPLHSTEGKSNVTGIRWSKDSGTVSWAGLTLKAKLPSKTQDPYLHEALKSRTKYCRILWRQIRGRRRWYVQLVQEGLPPAKYMFQVKGSPENKASNYSTVGLDIGPSTIALSATGHSATPLLVALVPLAPSVDPQYKEIRILQRAQDRSRRATNPDNYNTDGTIRKVVKDKQGKRTTKIWTRSSRYKARQADLADKQRKMAAARKRDHNQLSNQIVAVGANVKTETLSYVAFQKSFGRSVSNRAPGMLITTIRRKAESAVGKMENLNTRVLRMSQYDHKTGLYEKKPLSQRWHRLGGNADGSTPAGNPLVAETLVQRDVYSSFLAEHAEGDDHNPATLEREWQTAESLFRRAGLCVDQPASGMPVRAPAIKPTLLSSEWIARQRRHRHGHIVAEVRATTPVVDGICL